MPKKTYNFVLEETMHAYGDSNRQFSYEDRKLTFTATSFVSCEEAADIFKQALLTTGGYNNFVPECILDLRALFSTPKVRPGRNGSVAITVRGTLKRYVTLGLVKNALRAELVKERKPDVFYIYWG